MTSLYWAANLHLAATHRYPEGGRLMEVAFFLISYTWRIFMKKKLQQQQQNNNKNRITRIPFNLQEMK